MTMTMTIAETTTAPASQPVRRNWAACVQPYRVPSLRRAVLELAITVVPFAVSLSGLAVAASNGWWLLYAILLLPAAGFLVRLFMIQHDCGHGAFFPNRTANVWTGRLIGIFTLTPYDHWQRTHALHHAGAGNLDRRGVGDIDTLTITEYDARSRKGRLAYRLYRHPVILFLLGPTYVFALQNRLPVGYMRRGAMPWISTMGTNFGILALIVVASMLASPLTVAVIYTPVMMIAAAIGVWLFYVQHQFEDTYWARSTAWNAQDAALQGSSFYDLPQPLRWLSANIGLHHIHHLSSRIPFYRLQEVLDAYPELKDVGRITLAGSLATVRLVLWDETDGRLVSFAQYNALKRQEAAASH